MLKKYILKKHKYYGKTITTNIATSTSFKIANLFYFVISLIIVFDNKQFDTLASYHVILKIHTFN